MRKIFTLTFLLALTIPSLFSQKAAICGFNSSSPDGFSFVVLTDLNAGDAFFFTDGNYDPATNSFPVGSGNDAVISYTVPAGGLSEGEVIYWESGAGTTINLSRSGGGAAGSVTIISGNKLSIAGDDPLYLFNSSVPGSPHNNVTEIFCAVGIGNIFVSNTSLNPANDLDALVSIDFAPIVFNDVNVDNADFVFNGRVGTTFAEFTSVANWTTSATNLALSLTAFTSPGFGGFTLPVEWLDFSANQIREGVQLQWSTASELNNDFFVVERSNSNGNFEAITQVNATGNSDLVQAYSATDAHPLMGTNYYRIKQVDIDGNYSFSSVIEIDVMPGQIFYPNPATHSITFGEVSGALEIYDLRGKLIVQTTISQGQKLDISELAPGAYSLFLRAENGSLFSVRLLK